MSTMISFIYAYPTGFRGKYDLTQDDKVHGNRGHSVCRHTHRTEAAAIRCAEKTRATYRKTFK